MSPIQKAAKSWECRGSAVASFQRTDPALSVRGPVLISIRSADKQVADVIMFADVTEWKTSRGV